MTDGNTGNSAPLFTATEAPEEFVACHRLAEAMLPPHRLRALLRAAEGEPSAALSLPADRWQSPEIALTDKQTERLRLALTAPLPKTLLPTAERLGAWAILAAHPDFPAGLLPLGDSPPLLFGRGALQPGDSRSLAIVGSRRTTMYGRGQADRFARAFAERGIPIISGGAAGIDTSAHHATLEAGGRTVAVLGCGVDISYPAANRALFDRIAQSGQGAVISEFPLGTTPEPWRFPTRNRIIAGIAHATLVIESPEGSGALLTTGDALRYGREVWVVPGPVDTGRSRGCHRLLQDGAGCADAPEDLFHLFDLADAPARPASETARFAPSTAASRSPSPHPKDSHGGDSAAPTLPFEPAPLPPLSPDESRLLAQFSAEPLHLDMASERAELAAPSATVAATLLEMKNLIRRLPGGSYVRTDAADAVSM